MDARFLSRGFHTRPTPWLLKATRQQPSMLQQPSTSFLSSAFRYSSSISTPPPSTSNKSNDGNNSGPPKQAPTQATTSSFTSDFDEILNKLELSTGTRSGSEDALSRPSKSRSRLIFNGTRAGGGTAIQSRQPRTKLHMKLKPALGRMIFVQPERGMDLGNSIRNLEMLCTSNRVRAAVYEQKYHVRRGVQRKMLRMKRWRSLFRTSFGETVRKIQRMQSQGW
ncbi:hypothetical protein NUU61_002889 [Penicillium alfredii]|uniref:Ribosomal protein S21 n=1 Tax=Penicillium alfredii TaxID=1506179 RepID=A0A9W9KHP0_9EURO|nr:uncharacterized protein NUU61_002889 [Penicillium alfredii]KAJ5105542.1 hypothetical protein NUU61_002889 [Penicillium alfredii]